MLIRCKYTNNYLKEQTNLYFNKYKIIVVYIFMYVNIYVLIYTIACLYMFIYVCLRL